jgi:hypothetical protein
LAIALPRHVDASAARDRRSLLVDGIRRQRACLDALDYVYIDPMMSFH